MQKHPRSAEPASRKRLATLAATLTIAAAAHQIYKKRQGLLSEGDSTKPSALDAEEPGLLSKGNSTEPRAFDAEEPSAPARISDPFTEARAFKRKQVLYDNDLAVQVATPQEWLAASRKILKLNLSDREIWLLHDFAHAKSFGIFPAVTPNKFVQKPDNFARTSPRTGAPQDFVFNAELTERPGYGTLAEQVKRLQSTLHVMNLHVRLIPKFHAFYIYRGLNASEMDTLRSRNFVQALLPKSFTLSLEVACGFSESHSSPQDRKHSDKSPFVLRLLVTKNTPCLSLFEEDRSKRTSKREKSTKFALDLVREQNLYGQAAEENRRQVQVPYLDRGKNVKWVSGGLYTDKDHNWMLFLDPGENSITGREFSMQNVPKLLSILGDAVRQRPQKHEPSKWILDKNFFTNLQGAHTNERWEDFQENARKKTQGRVSVYPELAANRNSFAFAGNPDGLRDILEFHEAHRTPTTRFLKHAANFSGSGMGLGDEKEILVAPFLASNFRTVGFTWKRKSTIEIIEATRFSFYNVQVDDECVGDQKDVCLATYMSRTANANQT